MKIKSDIYSKSEERERIIADFVLEYGWCDGFSVIDANLSEQGHTSFILLEPTLRIWGDILGSNIEFADGEKLRFEDPWDALQGELLTSIWKYNEKRELPIVAGLFNYEILHLIESISYPASDSLRLPLYAFFAYRKIIEVPLDISLPCSIHEVDAIWTKGALWGVDLERMQTLSLEKANYSVKLVQANKEYLNLDLASYESYSNFSESEYRAAITQVQQWIKAGDVYQVNLTQRFELPYTASPEVYYLIVRDINPAMHSAFFRFTGFPGKRGFSIASISPELFIHSDGDFIKVSPIKGTARREEQQDRDDQVKMELKKSEKNLAELSMIVDLMRNDLSKIAKRGSVKVIEHARLETLPTLHHLVSDIQCQSREDLTFIDIIKATFPSGSVSGAPKIAAMKCISHLEKSTRGVYCGAIGYLGLGGAFKFSVAIRTALLREKKIYISAGGGIVADSIPSEEYQESLLKAKAMLVACRIAQESFDVASKDNSDSILDII